MVADSLAIASSDYIAFASSHLGDLYFHRFQESAAAAPIFKSHCYRPLLCFPNFARINSACMCWGGDIFSYPTLSPKKISRNLLEFLESGLGS